MKKLLSVVSSVFIVCIFISCNSPKTDKTVATNSNGNSKSTTPENLSISLNGIDSALAMRMINHFDSIKSKDKSPTPLSVWISKNEIHAIIDLLDSEIKNEKPTQGTGDNAGDDMMGITDGIRIHFACDPNAVDLQNTTSIILVSTKDHGIYNDASCPSGKKHLDYFTHSSDAALFKMGNINGLPCNGKSNCSGSLLYSLLCTKCVDDPKCPWSPHNILVKQARKMVRNFGKQTINSNSEWFDLSMWKTLDRDTTVSGIRIYFATNSKCKNDASEYEKKKSLRDGFVITPTKYNKDSGVHEDNFKCNSGIDYFRSYVSFYKNDKYRKLLGPNQDNGELCPNNCN